MKHFWNYIFYFTWQLHNVIGRNCVEKPLDRLFSLSTFWDKHNKRGKKDAKNIIENPYYGFNVGFSFRCMLTTTTLLFANFEILIFFSLDTNLSEILNYLFDITIPHEFNPIAFFSSTVFFAYISCDILLGWHRNHYIKYFKEFKRQKNVRIGYLLAIAFHLSMIILLIVLILYFDV